MSTNNLLNNLKGVDTTGLPPCQSELTAQVNRSAFIARMWANANENHIDQHPKQQNGWELQDNIYRILWFEGQQLPDTLVPEDDESTEPSSDNDFDLASSDDEGNLDSDDEPNELITYPE